MKLFSSTLPAALMAVIVSLELASAAHGDWIYANRRSSYRYDGTVFHATMDVYDTGTGDDVTPAGFNTSYTQAVELEGLAYYDGCIYSSSSANGDGEVTVYNAYTGALVDTISVSTTGTARGLVFDSDGYLYCGVRTDCKIHKISADGTSVNEWAAVPDKSGDMEIYGDYLYVGTANTDDFGVWVYDLTSATPTPSLVTGTSGARVDGIAFTEDGTMYTVFVNKNNNYLKKWNRNSYGSYTEDVAARVAIDSAAKDVDYVDGCLYICTNDYAILEYDLSASDPELTTWQSASGIYTKCGYLVAAPEVPEPGTLALLASGLIGLLAYAWKKRK